MNFHISPPGWVDCEAKPNEGLDLLGLRNPVQRIGNAILNGITSITPNIRYLSLRSWIIWRFSQSGLPASWKSFQDFSNRVECAITLGNVLVGDTSTAIVGSDKAKEILSSRTKELKLERLVKSQTAVDIYASSCSDLGISFDSEIGVAGISKELGLPLAKVVENQVSATAFGSSLKGDPQLAKVPREYLAEFGKAVQLSRISNPEKEPLIAALFSRSPFESPETYQGRIATFGILLSLADRYGGDLTEDEFFKACVHPPTYLSPVLTSYLDRWVGYLVRDMIAVVHEFIFSELLQIIEPICGRNGFTTIETAKRKMLSREKGFKNILRSVGLDIRSNSIGDMPFVEFRKRIDAVLGRVSEYPTGLCRWKKSLLTEQNIINLAMDDYEHTLALAPMAWLIARKRIKTEERSWIYQALSDEGHSRLGLRQVIVPTLAKWERENYSLRKVWDDLVETTVQQHLRISHDRLRINQKRDVSCVALSEERLSYKQGMRPGRTLSRIPQAIGWLIQLGLIKEDGLTVRGKAELQRILTSLRKGSKNESS